MIKPREMWAVVHPEGWILDLGEDQCEAQLRAAEHVLGGWCDLFEKGYRCVKVKVTAEEI